MEFEKVIIRDVEMRMKSSFTTSFGTVQNKRFLIVELYDKQGNCGYGECDAFEAPWYTEETIETALHVLQQFLVPLLFEQNITHPSEVNKHFKKIRRHQMAKAALECAVWDLYAKQQRQPLYQLLGGVYDRVKVGISIGLQQTDAQLFEKIDTALANGYERIKVKIKPGKDIELLKVIRKKYPDIPLMADANSAYTLNDLAHLKKLDQFNLLMIEQPLAADDILQHSKLQQQLTTPICLDESICSLADAQTAIELGACGVINVKLARVGGIQEAKEIHDLCMAHHIPVWCGGMLEAGIGRAHALALSSLQNFILPSDLASSSNYWQQDIITPEVVVENGKVLFLPKNGIGYEVNNVQLNKHTKQQFILQNKLD